MGELKPQGATNYYVEDGVVYYSKDPEVEGNKVKIIMVPDFEGLSDSSEVIVKGKEIALYEYVYNAIRQAGGVKEDVTNDQINDNEQTVRSA